MEVSASNDIRDELRSVVREHLRDGVSFFELVQGELIPVYIANISVVRPFFLDVGVRIVHMLLMSWAGKQASHVRPKTSQPRLQYYGD